MKKIALTMMALLTMMTAVAQKDDNNARKAPKKPTAEEMTNRMTEQLGLTDKQKSKVLALNKEYADVLGGPGMGRPHMGPRPDGNTGATEQAPEKKERPQMTDAQKKERPQLTDAQKKEMEQKMAKRKEYDGKLKKILTDEQMQKYQQMRHHRGHGGRGGRGGHGGPKKSNQE